MTYEQARETLLKMAFAESTEFAEDRLFAFGYSDEHEALMIAIEALEKQIPKKPIAYDKSWNGTTVYKCPVCNSPLGTKSFNEEQNQVGCARCLSAIDWSEVE